MDEKSQVWALDRCAQVKARGLIEIKGLARSGRGTVLLTPNERRVAQDRRDCYWLYMAADCAEQRESQETIWDPARLPWDEVKKLQHYLPNG